MPSDTAIILSVAPEYAGKILTGEKAVELRRRVPRISDGTRAWLYSTLPAGEVIALLTIDSVVELPVEEIWNRYGPKAKIDKSAFDEYFAGLETGAVLIIRDVSALKQPVSLNEMREEGDFHPPQFYRRLKPNGPDSQLGHRELHPPQIIALA